MGSACLIPESALALRPLPRFSHSEIFHPLFFGQVLLSEFVKLSVKVLDYQTAITGVSAKLLENVTYTHSDAQKAVLELLSEPGTILVGHGLQHDLRSADVTLLLLLTS